MYFITTFHSNQVTLHSSYLDPKQLNLSSKGDSHTVCFQAGLEGNSENNPQGNTYTSIARHCSIL